MLTNIELRVVSLANGGSPNGNHSLILGEKWGDRQLPLVIGPFEAQAIARSLKGIKSPYPLTHDLFSKTLTASGVALEEVIITELLDGFYQCVMIVRQPMGNTEQIDARPSDAIALALRCECPIYATEEVLEQTQKTPQRRRVLEAAKHPLKSCSMDDLQSLLEEVLANEDYQKAAQIRDEMLRREG